MRGDWRTRGGTERETRAASANASIGSSAPQSTCAARPPRKGNPKNHVCPCLVPVRPYPKRRSKNTCLRVFALMATVSRLSALARLRCSIFQTSYNPTCIRTGAKYLRKRLRGPSMVRYYPQEINLSQIARQYPELELVNEDEEQRFLDVDDRKRRGKGAPKKADKKSKSLSSRIIPRLTGRVRGKQENQKKTMSMQYSPPLATHLMDFNML